MVESNRNFGNFIVAVLFAACCAMPAHAAPKAVAWEPPATKAAADDIKKANQKKCLEWLNLAQTYVVKDSMSADEKALYRDLNAAQQETTSLCQDQESYDTAISEKLKSIEAENARIKPHEDKLRQTAMLCANKGLAVDELSSVATANGVTIGLSVVTALAGGTSIATQLGAFGSKDAGIDTTKSGRGLKVFGNTNQNLDTIDKLNLIRANQQSTLNKVVSTVGAASGIGAAISSGMATFAQDFDGIKTKINNCQNSLAL
jgi:hypothetical protein